MHATSDKQVAQPSTSTMTPLKHSILKSIKSNDVQALSKLHELHQFDISEDCSPNNTKWTPLHYACYYESIVTLSFLLKTIYRTKPATYTSMVNMKTVEGWTPLMITAIHDKPDNMNLLIMFGGLNIHEKDSQGLRAADLAMKYKHERVATQLKKLMNIYPLKLASEEQGCEIPLNTTLLAHQDNKLKPVKEIANFEDQEEYQELLKNGKRIPCQLCNGDRGLLKYTVCCGEPAHRCCLNNASKCPFCGAGRLALSFDIKYPEKALRLEENNEVKA